ncbi:helix-turn-helix domain-containing protein [Nocardia terpenica]|uniref:XRE family transcriptional regulator n=1 Tax=Nocardia terpenica TaxID=455432 RepID=A0A291RJH1_9NOCA|nr:helix-turn-helix transcriptional regulator [Nocardia terpenica]ATL67304.1 XRE family transcriptional regulator [Nocardia terpenica]
MTDAGSTLARRALGRELLRLRTKNDLTKADAARAAEVSPQSIGRTEEGLATRITALQTNALCNLFGATKEERKMLLGLVAEIRSTEKSKYGWWRAYLDQLADDFNHYLALEDAARRLTAWRVTIIPGLLQTPEYRRAIAWAILPNSPADEVEKFIELATRRQARLEDPNFALEVFLSEAVLLDEVGGPAVMNEQLLHLVNMAERPNISIRIVPLRGRPTNIGSYVGSFYYLEFPPLGESKHVEPPIVYIEEYAGDLYLDRKGEWERYERALRGIDRVALDQDQSRQAILEVAEEYAE